MKTVVIISQKGGAGKTTLAVHLAIAAEKKGLTSAILDIDPQGSALDWKESRSNETPEVIMAQSKQVGKILEAAQKAGTDLVLVDTAPHSESTALEAAQYADVILIPCRPAIFDIRAIKTTRDLALLAKKPAFVVLNAVPHQGSLTDEAIAGITLLDMQIAPVQLGQRQAFIRSLTEGLTAQEFEPKGKAATEINEFYAWLESVL
jgi:chromosome partitioning protein